MTSGCVALVALDELDERPLFVAAVRVPQDHALGRRGDRRLREERESHHEAREREGNDLADIETRAPARTGRGAAAVASSARPVAGSNRCTCEGRHDERQRLARLDPLRVLRLEPRDDPRPARA